MLLERVQGDWSTLRNSVFVCAMALMPFSEWRIVKYDFGGPRSFSFFHIVFILSMALLLFNARRLLDLWRGEWKRLAWVLCPLLATLLHLFVVTPEGSMVKSHSFLMSVFVAVGTLTALMLIDFKKLIRGIFIYVCIMLSVLMIPAILLMTGLFWRWHSEIGDIFTLSYMNPRNVCFFVALPFIHPNHAAFFMLAGVLMMIGILSSGVLSLSLRFRAYVLVFAVAATALAIALLGSRTGVGLFVSLVPLVCVGVLTQEVFLRRTQSRNLVLMASVLMGGVFIGGLMITTQLGNPCIERAITMLDHSISDVLTGRADKARHALWSYAIPSLRDSDWAVGADKPIEGFNAREVVSTGGNLHSVLLDLYTWAGPFAAAFFVIFLIAMAGLGIRKAYGFWGAAIFPIYWASIMIVIVIAVFMYIQPVEYFAPIWVAIGVILRLFLKPSDNTNIIGG